MKLLERQRFVLKISFGVCHMSVKVQYDGTSPVFENNKITAACIGESADIDRNLATGTTEFIFGKDLAPISSA